MKTIEIKIGEQTAQFTTKSVTFDGKEFFYSKMSDVKHIPDEKSYSFTYEGQTKTLPYEEKDLKILNAIFSQVINMQTQKSTAQDIDSSKQTLQNEDTAKVASETSDSAVQESTEQVSESENNAENAASENETTEPEQPEDKKAAKKAEKERKKAERARIKAEQKAAKDEKSEKDEVSEETAAELKSKRKKSIITFAIVIGIVAIVAVAYYFIFGTSDNPSAGPNSTESQQYEDIDQLIDDLQ